MTNEEALYMLKHLYSLDSNDPDVVYAYSKAFGMAIKALEQQPCDDAISRTELLKAIDTYDKFGYTITGCFVRNPKGDYIPYVHYYDVVNCVNSLLSVTPKPKTGHWKDRSEGGRIKYPWMESYECSECGENGSVAWDYCPNCGANMESEEK